MKSENYYKQIFEQSQDGILLADVSTMKFIDANNSICQLLGYSKDEILQLSVSEIHPENDLPMVIDAFEKQAKGIYQIAKELPCLRKDGSIFYADINTQAITVEGKTCNLGLFRDVSDRRKTEIALKETNRNFNQLLESIDDVIWEADMQSNILYISQAVEKVYGRTIQEFRDNPALWHSITHPEDRDIVNKSHEELYRLNHANTIYRIIHKDGSIRWLQDKKNIIKDKNGKAIRIGGIATDITKQKEFEQNIDEQRLNLQKLYDNISDQLWILDLETLRIIDINPTAHRTLGFSKAELLRLSVPDIDRNFSKESAFKVVELLREKSQCSFDSTHTRKDGSKFPVHIRLNKTIYNKKPAIIVSCRDMTTLKYREEALIKEKDRAEAANHAKSTFLANMSHELRTPLNGILGMAQVLEMSITDKEQRDHLQCIKQSGIALVNILQDILDIAKIEAGKLSILSEEFNFTSLIDQVTKLFSIQTVNKNITLATSISKSIPEILLGDELRIKQIITNLVGNAIKFTEKGSVEVKANSILEDNNCILKIEVCDTGIGIPEDIQNTVFEAFSRGNDIINRKYEGTGLGLSIVDRLTGLMNGKIDMKSQVNKGSIFTVTLPLLLPQKNTNINQLNKNSLSQAWMNIFPSP
ncbi:MAG: PAS domain S-box protein [Fibrobacteria bacterium]|nr:PAS domain S-box protein [Fibrobacteria bacterium]